MMMVVVMTRVMASIDTITAMSHARDLKNEEVRSLLNALTQAQASLAQNQAEQVSKIAQAYTTGGQYAAQQARLSPPHSNALSEPPNSVRQYDLPPRDDNVVTAQPTGLLATTSVSATTTSLSAKSVGVRLIVFPKAVGGVGLLEEQENKNKRTCGQYNNIL
jgi:hypothetical protein